MIAICIRFCSPEGVNFHFFCYWSYTLIISKINYYCLNLIHCVTKRRHMRKNHLIFFSCIFIIDSFLFWGCSTKGTALRKEPHSGWLLNLDILTSSSSKRVVLNCSRFGKKKIFLKLEANLTGKRIPRALLKRIFVLD